MRDPGDKARLPRASLPRRIGRLIRNVLAIVGLFAIIYHCCFDLSQVVSGSMGPALLGEGDANSDWVLIDKVSYRFREPRRWEIIQCENSEHLQVAKRVVGLPGEKVAIQDRNVVINGRRITPPPLLAGLKYVGCGSVYPGREAECGQGYFVLGDDTRDSYDSRFEGPVAPEAIRGRVWLRVWPPSRIACLAP